MTSPVQTRQWRKHAEELRVIAADSSDAPTRKTLLKIADDWDLMAERADTRASAERTIRKR